MKRRETEQYSLPEQDGVKTYPGFQKFFNSLCTPRSDFNSRTNQIIASLACIIILSKYTAEASRTKELHDALSAASKWIAPERLHEAHMLAFNKTIDHTPTTFTVSFITHTLLHAHIKTNATAVFIILEHLKSFNNLDIWKQFVDVVQDEDSQRISLMRTSDALKRFLLKVGYCPPQLHELVSNVFPDTPENKEIRALLLTKKSQALFNPADDNNFKVLLKHARDTNCNFRAHEYRTLVETIQIDALGNAKKVRGIQSLCDSLHSPQANFTLRTSQITRAIAAIIILKEEFISKQEYHATEKSKAFANAFKLVTPSSLKSKFKALQTQRNGKRNPLNVNLITHSLLHARSPGDITSIFVMLNYFQSDITSRLFWNTEADVIESYNSVSKITMPASEILKGFFLRIGYCPLQFHTLITDVFPDTPENHAIRALLQNEKSQEEFKHDVYLENVAQYARDNNCVFKKDEYRDLFDDLEAMGLTQTYIISRSSTSSSYTTISNPDNQPEEDLKVQSTDEISTVDPNNISANVNIPEQLIRTWQLATPLPFQYATPNEPNTAFNSTTHLPNDIPNTNIIIGQDSLEYNPPLSPLPEVPDFLS